MVFPCIATTACTANNTATRRELQAGLQPALHFSCSEGHRGMLCAKCRPGWTENGEGGCTVCPNQAESYLITIMVVLGALLVYSFLILKANRRRRLSATDSVIFRVLLNYLQTLGFTHTVAREISPVAAFATSVATSVFELGSNLAAVGCATRMTVTTKFYGTVMAPVVLGVFGVAVATLDAR